MIIKIDNRETELLDACKFMISCSPSFKDLILEVVNLPIGDVIICDDKCEKVIIERKSLNDLAASIKDGRYDEQSYRLNGSDIHNHNIIYLIEGDLSRYNTFKQRIDKLTLYSSMVSLNYYKGFSVFRSLDIQESALIVCNMAYKISRSEKDGKLPFYKNSLIINKNDNKNSENKDENKDENKVEKVDVEKVDVEKVDLVDVDVDVDVENKASSKDYCSVVKKVKKDNITTDNIGEIMLCQIPGISSVTALAIMQQYNTISNLIIKIKENRDCLKDISYTNAKGQVRKISKTVIANIIKYLQN